LRRGKPNRNGDIKHREDGHKEKKCPYGKFSEYTPLKTSREKILKECANTKFKEAGNKFPQEVKESARTDMSKYCQFHMYHDHKTNEYAFRTRMRLLSS
jgi:hypothetical protein